MHVHDIIEAIRHRDLQAGLRALVGHPHEEAITGATPEPLMAALDAACVLSAPLGLDGQARPNASIR